MKLEIKTTKEVDVKFLQVDAGVRYWEDATVDGKEDTEGDLIPCKEGDLWRPLIDVETGKIVNWNLGTTADVHYKVCDCCGWSLLDGKGEPIYSMEDGYVPLILSPEGPGYGDYIIMKILQDGTIQNWKADLESLFPEE